ncbi:MAG: hypothetical protein VB010_11985 [Sphaerochaeta associata]|uniref:hypothetical protein n=1 Tax=Sphaerochaeta associata TaxID=1129264 RepID=UPI002B1FBE57|nr:hypothetical protein [Sphaerochaeta associata]MEA5108055.1 hypothetical protein [Sphaerochaeta associata]
MKKMFVLVLLVPILTIALISCDADIRSNIADFMGGLGGNVYIDNGLVQPNTADAEAAVAVIANLGTGTGATAVTAGSSSSEFGISITVPAGVEKILKPQTTAEQTTFKNDIATALTSPTQTQTLLVELEKPIEDAEQKKAVEGTVAVFNATITKLTTDLPDGEVKTALANLTLDPVDTTQTITQGDVLILQMMTNLISNTVATLNTVSNNNIGGLTDSQLENNQTQVLSIVDDALFTAQIAEQLSGSATIDFSGQLDLASLLGNLNKGSKASRGTIELTDAGDFIGTINNIIPDLVELLGVKDGEYSKADYQKFILNQRAYRSSIEHALSFAKKGNLTSAQLQNRGVSFDTSTLIKYIFAVLMTEHHDYWKSVASSDTPRPETIILAYLNANPKLAAGTLTVSDSITAPTIKGFDYDGFPAHLTDTTVAKKGKEYIRAIINNLIAINNIGGIAQLTEALEDFLAEDFDEWFADLV